MGTNMSKTLSDIAALIEERRGQSPDTSYVASLFAKGTKKIAEKVGEEAVETVIAGIVEDRQSLINESADLLFHLSVLWAERDVTPDNVMAELQKRMGISGLDEKAARQAASKAKKKAQDKNT